MAEKKANKKSVREKKESVKKSEKKKEEKREEVIEKVNENIEKAEETEEKKEEAKPNKKQIFEENKTLIIFLGVLFVLAATFVIYLIVSNNAKTFSYNGVKYTIVQQGQITFYNTVLPLTSSTGSKVNYNFYIRNDPRTLEKTIPFNGTISVINPVMDLNYSNGIQCNGYGTIAVANVADLYTALGSKVIRDPNATCDPEQKYTYVNIELSNETNVQEIAPSCYIIHVANCEILQGTERFMTATFSALHAAGYM